MGKAVSDNSSDPIGEKIDRFAQKCRLWIVIPLVICALLAIADLRVGVGFFLFFLFIWVVTQTIDKILNFAGRLFPSELSADQRKALQEAGCATLFLGGLAIVGVLLRGDNFLSNLVAENIPAGMGLGFIDPTFASVVLLVVWVYTYFQIKR